MMHAIPVRCFKMKSLWCALLTMALILMITYMLILKQSYMHIFQMLTGIEVDSNYYVSGQPPPFQQGNYSGVVHEKWIVADYTSSECSDTPLKAPPEWKLILIGGNGTVKNCTEPSCFVIVPEADISKSIPPEGRQLWWLNVAYFIAISRGAVQILDVDCRMMSTNALDILNFGESDFTGLMYNGTRHFNPYRHFGAWSVFTGLTEREQNNDSTQTVSYIRNLSRVFVLHGLSDLSDDHQLSKVSHGISIGLSFKSSAPPVFIGQATFSPTAPLCTLYRQEAFWGLLLPCFSQLARCSVIRYYITQRLLWEVDGFTGFYPIEAAFRVPESGQSPAAKYINILGNNTQIDRLAIYLQKWICKPEMTFYSCFEALALDLVGNGTLHPVDVVHVQNWVTSLRAAGLREPARILKAWRGVRKVSDVRVVLGADLKTLTGVEGSRTLTNLQRDLVDNFTAKCAGDSANFSSLVTHWMQPIFEDIVLIVDFNENQFFFSNLAYLETIHRPFFRYIIYCVPNLEKLLADSRHHLPSHVTLIEAHSHSWFLKYECISHAAALHIPESSNNYHLQRAILIQGVKGYLQIADDTLLNSCMLKNVSLDSLWLARWVKTRHVGTGFKWVWWKTANGRPAVMRALAEIEHISGMTSQQILSLDPNNTANSSVREMTFADLFGKISSTFRSLNKKPLPGSETWRPPSREEAKRFLENYYGEHHMTGKLAIQNMDFFYVPQNLISSYVTFSRIFMKYRAMAELAVTTMYYGIARKSAVNYAAVRFLWGGERSRVPAIYSNFSLIALHSFKVMCSITEEKKRHFFCHQYLGGLFSERDKISRENLRHGVSWLIELYSFSHY